MVIETQTFRLAAGADEDAFLAADRRVQDEFIPRHAGFLRRTTARGDDGDWLVIVLWYTAADADASAALAADHPATTAFRALLDGATLRTTRYETLS
jgi:hypothetical protein